MHEKLLGKYFSLQEFCTCTQTCWRYVNRIDPHSKSLEETILALEALCQHILDPVISLWSRAVSVDLRLLLSRLEAVSEPERLGDRG